MSKSLNEKSYFALLFLVAVYFFSCLYVLSAGYSQSESYDESIGVTHFVSQMATIVPTIMPTAAITPMPNESEIILSIAWALVIPAAILMLLFADWSQVDDENNNADKAVASILAGIPLLVMMYCFMQFFIPEPGSTPKTKFIYFYLKDTDWFVIVYGLLLWGLSAVFLFIIIYKTLMLIRHNIVPT